MTVANNVEGSGENAEVQIRAESSEHVQIVKTPSQTLRIAEGREQSTAFSVHVNDKLGSGTITFIATAGGKETRLRSTISVRPPTTFMTQVRSGSFTKTSVDVPIDARHASGVSQAHGRRSPRCRWVSPTASMFI